MTDNKIALSSLAMDLKRVALGYHKGSYKVANRFLEEALRRSKDVDKTKVKPYIKEVIEKIEKMSLERDKRKAAEDALLYSTLLQNASLV